MKRVAVLAGMCLLQLLLLWHRVLLGLRLLAGLANGEDRRHIFCVVDGRGTAWPAGDLGLGVLAVGHWPSLQGLVGLLCLVLVVGILAGDVLRGGVVLVRDVAGSRSWCR